jgi:hypothetical protein
MTEKNIWIAGRVIIMGYLGYLTMMVLDPEYIKSISEASKYAVEASVGSVMALTGWVVKNHFTTKIG